ncbi:cation transporting ATPase C-terminal domain-containing protein [Aquiflexum sp.]|uniref:cation transporting ATPase C-terminal domain-containing protein n=1 Tax=Aquiflexum sp. TaxID=1872584 RepID=UPI0035935646
MKHVLIVLLPLVFGWEFTVIFTPIHVIFLELIMGPTCSIVFENEPIEPDSMNKPPRVMSKTFFSWSELSLSVVQGLAITGACLGFGFYLMDSGHSEASVRTLIFSTLVFSNIFLTLVNRSFYYSVFKTLTYHNRLVPIILGISLILLVVILTIPSIMGVFDFEPVSFNKLLISLLIASIGVFWIEVWKFFKREKAMKI